MSELDSVMTMTALWLAALAAMIALAALAFTLWLEHRRRHQAELQARRYLAAMTDLNRRAALSSLTVSIAHELHQPLGAILRNAEAAKMLLESASPDLAELRDIVDDIRSDDKRAAEIIRRVRSLAQKHERDETAVDLNDVVRETVGLVAGDAASKSVRLRVDLLKEPAFVAGDRVHLQQALLNLVLNGLEAMAGTPEGDRLLTVATGRHDGYVEMSVHDRGPGIGDGTEERIFEPFFSTKSEGMGIGLFITRGIVESHNGRIVATNTGRGAAVRISLPRV